MFDRARKRLLGDQRGFTLIEGLVAGMLLVSAMTATYGMLASSGRAEQDQRLRSQSYAIAQDDQSRLRSLRITQLMTLNQTRTVTQDGTSFTVTSKGQFVNDLSGTNSCDDGAASADYIKISSTVTWTGGRGHAPTTIESVVAPPNGTFGVDRGTLAVAVRDSQGNPVAGVPLALSSVGSQTTGTNGCAIFANVPEGDYTLTPSTAVGVVDKDGAAPGPQTVSVVAQATNTVALQYDTPGKVNVTFTTRIGGVVKASKADSIVIFNSGMTKEAVFGTIGTEATTIQGTPLFPFASADTIYAGNCTYNNPNPTNIVNPPAAAALTTATILRNQTVNATPIQLPALQLTVRTGNSASSPGSIVTNASVTITDTQCTTSSGGAVKRTYVNNTTITPAGLVPTGQTTADPGMPYGIYNICAYNGSRRNTASAVPIQTTATDTTRTIYLGSGATGSTTGACP